MADEQGVDEKRFEQDQAAYLAERARLAQVYSDAEKNYDQNLIYLSAGALGLSMAFAKDIAHKPPTFGLVNREVCFLKLMDGLNRTSLISFGVGVILLGVFIYRNLA